MRLLVEPFLERNGETIARRLKDHTSQYIIVEIHDERFNLGSVSGDRDAAFFVIHLARTVYGISKYLAARGKYAAVGERLRLLMKCSSLAYLKQ